MLCIDFSPIKSGGGAQLALNFLDHLKENNNFDGCFLLISEKFPFKSRVPSEFPVILAPSSPVKRVLFENCRLRKIFYAKGIDKVYTFFGPGLPCMQGIKQVVGVAYPIICNDESQYWQYLDKKVYFRKKIVNFFRKKRLKRSDYLVFETEVMRNRCVNILPYNVEKTFVIPPTPTKYVTESSRPFMQGGGLKLLVLSGLDYHKNIWRLIEVSILARKKSIKFNVVISSTKKQFLVKYNRLVTDKFLKIIDDYFEFLGPIPSDEIQRAYDSVDVVINISDLESFSNNYMEAWLARKPIIASDRDFSRHICGGSAVYVEPHAPSSLLDAIELFLNSEIDISKMKEEGVERIKRLPSLNQKVSMLEGVLR
ncbi:glycosyltransferase [Halomonas daqiaonensis]|uniref:Glycosyltransferase involved in cell wall bisynthesis n=1 Tax=Halomonas daqiaonensis TaxID=650850 RepID=A0A1H7GLL5_9GAMM|nr:glycosyltransferase [Halomonas daqiaonensis]SEK39056.1 Glycosyltransferase involved in cell wall bisynthesis [Halomonas daqiaonensis]